MQDKPNIWRALRYYGLRGVRFLQHDIWRLRSEEIPAPLRLVVECIKVAYQATVSFINDDLMTRASSLTYSTVLSIVPMLAVIVGIAKGFGLQGAVLEALKAALPGQTKQLDQVFVYVENYLSQVQGGLFIGLGLGILLYTVLMLISSIEDAFNDIWQAPHARPWGRRIFDYLGLFLLLPLLLLASSVITLMMTTIRQTYAGDVEVVHSVLDSVMSLVPFVLSVGIFIGLYMYLPNVRVRFLPALISGILAGIAYQIFQALYISGVIWISRYNAIYGSFAAFPLLLLWMQLSWTITLYGAQLAYTIQNIHSFAFGQASMKVSRRYLDFVSLLILGRIVQRFADPEGGRPYSARAISDECHIPIRMVGQVLSRLREVGLIIEVQTADNADAHYQPALDPEFLTVNFVITRLDKSGTEDFRIDRHGRYAQAWNAMEVSRGLTTTHGISPDTLLRDLTLD